MADRLVDTSVLTRSLNRNDPEHRVARDSVRLLRDRGEELCVAPQNLYELWAVCTRPETSNGLQLGPEHALRVIQQVEETVTLLRDTDALYDEWKRLVLRHRVSGKPSHDARLVAAMNLHGVRGILTFNVRDFTRYPDLSVLHPRDA